MPHGIMPDSARQEGSATTYGLINMCSMGERNGRAEFDKWWHKHDNTKEFGHCIRQMSDDQLYAAWEHALKLQKNEKFTEAWPLLAMLSELLGHAIADRENILPEQRP
jgi:hypothetical protein